MHMPVGILDAMEEVLKTEDRAQRRQAAKQRAKGRH